MPLLSAVTKVKIRMHLGYLNVQEAYTFVIGRPEPVLAQFTIEGAFDRLIAEALPMVMSFIDNLDGLHAQMLGDQELLAVNKIGEIEIRQDEFKGIISQYKYWQGLLANAFGVAPYPYDQRWGGGNVQGRNVRVMG